MSVPAIRAAIVAKVSAVANIGAVFDYQRYEPRADALASLYRVNIGGQDQIRGWWLSRVSTEERSPALGRWQTVHTWRLRGYMSLDDATASEKTFDALIESLRTAFRTDDTLGGVVASTVMDDGTAGLQLTEQVPVLFAGVLCHSADMRLLTWLNI
jgi:hypothetical protein